MSLQELVEQLVTHVAAQTDAMERTMPGTGNRHARQYAAALAQLRALGNTGMDALATLLTHPRGDVVTMAASYLLQHGFHVEAARKSLEEAARGEGLLAWGAAMTLKRWAEGTLTPEPGVDSSPEAPGEEPDEPPRLRGRPNPHQRPRPGQPLPLPASLAPHRALLEQARAPCILFDKVVGAPSPRGCRYGGLPFLPPGTSWPRSPEGPLHFLGQLDFAELAECRGEHLPELPKEGLLAFFYDVENQPWGTKPSHRAFWELIHVPPGSEQVPLSPPAELLRAERPVLPLRHLRPSLGLSLPGWADLNAPVEPDFWSEEQGEDIIELRRALAGTDNPDQGADQLRGHPNWWQEDGRIDAQLASNGIDAYRSDLSPQEERLKSGASEWTLLWQVGTDEELDLVWGSQGTLYLLIRNKDLRARRFDRAWLILQCS